MREDDGGGGGSPRTSSAKPAKLLDYSTKGIKQVESWETEQPKLETALTDLRTALSNADLPEDVSLFVPFYETWFDTLNKNQRHLDEWVGDVAKDFIAAGGFNKANPDQVITVSDWQITVGFADRAESVEQAEQDAERIEEILAETGLVHPYDLSNNPEKLEELAEQYPELRDILARSERFIDDEAYGAAFVNELGADNVRTMADLTNSFGLAQDRGLIDGDAYEGYVVPFAAILASADRSGEMDESVRDALFDMDATDEPPFEGTTDDNFIYEDAAAAMRQRSMALLLNAGDFSAQTTAEMADAILRENPTTTSYGQYEGFTNAQFLQDHRELASNDWAAFKAVEDNPKAANIFYDMDKDGDGHRENLMVSMNWATGDNAMHRAPGVDLAAQRLGVSPDDLRPELQQVAANSVKGGLFDYPLAAGETYDPRTTAMVSDAIEIAGWDYVDVSDDGNTLADEPGGVFERSDAMRAAMARVSTPYTEDIALIATGSDDHVEASRLDVDIVDIQSFMREVSTGEQGRVILSQNAAALLTDQVIDAGPNRDDFGTGERLTKAYYSELGGAWNDVVEDEMQRRAALEAGYRSVTDPVIDLVSGKIVEKIPVVSTAADLPLASNVVDGITGEIQTGINDALYGDLRPTEDELNAMTDWEAAIGTDVDLAIEKGLYQNPETRAMLLEKAGLDPEADISFERFSGLDAVINERDYYREEIMDGLKADLAYRGTYG